MDEGGLASAELEEQTAEGFTETQSPHTSETITPMVSSNPEKL